MTGLGDTPSQTVGPFFASGCPGRTGPYVVAEGTPGAFWLRGPVVDGAGEPVPDALVETWQADPDGRFDHPDDPRGAVAGAAGFRGFARCATDRRHGRSALSVPGACRARTACLQAPHIDVSVFARGLLDRVVTRIYFPDEPGQRRRPGARPRSTRPARDTLIAVAGADGGSAFDIILQGDDETVFFAI